MFEERALRRRIGRTLAVYLGIAGLGLLEAIAAGALGLGRPWLWSGLGVAAFGGLGALVYGLWVRLLPR